MSAWRVSALMMLVLLALASDAMAQTGVSDDRVSLPEGPGSLEGVGENAELDPNMGVMRYSVDIDVPQGFAGVTPELRLSYSSGNGGSTVGMGWMLDIPHIERMTYRGLPEYTLEDDMAADGGQQLVLLPGSNPPTYRARYEKGFVRYQWHDAGDGTQGYWTAEYPDGRVGYFGATADGSLVADARVGGEEGTFRYMLVEMVDVYGHSLRYTYQKSGAVALIRQLSYVFTRDPQQPRYSVSFQYQERMDDTGFDYLSDAKGGFEELLTQRLAAINVFSGAERIRRYELSYEPYADSGGFTRLAQVRMLGLDGEAYPIQHSFSYSRALGGVCGDSGCDQPFVVEMGNIGVNIGVGQATLLDINGDSLPDILDTTGNGAHSFWLNVPTEDGSSRFEDAPRSSAVSAATGSGFRLGTPYVHALDTNGDGFTDLLNAQTGGVLLNRGQGDWERVGSANAQGLADVLTLDFDVAEGELLSARFLDYDNDKRIDLLRSTRTETQVMRNTADGFVVDPEVEALGYGIRTDKIDFSDMNGDGLLDAVKLNVNSLRYRLNLGWGRWGDEVEVLDLPLEESELDKASLEDLNGDGLSDLVVVTGSQIKYAINRNGQQFTNITTLGPDEVAGSIPDGSIPATVVYADMNGSGSTDIVWLLAQGDVKYMELFPVRPNLLSRIENGIGYVTEVTYGTSVSHMARDGGWESWEHRLPYPMQVVDRLDHYDTLTDVHEVTSIQYRDGFYDGVEKQFRGYARVALTHHGDATQEDGATMMRFDVGATDPYRNGLILHKEMSSADRLLFTQDQTYEDCALAEVPSNTALPVRYLCTRSTTKVMQEGAEPSQWATISSEMEYDGYGNVVLQRDLGVTALGGQGCAPCQGDAEDFGAPCGQQCLGDEHYTETEFIQPGPQTSGRWILGASFRQSRYGRPGSDLKDETLTYYDGEAFEGMPLGSLDQGKVTRMTRKVDSGKVIASMRHRHDEHGNVIEVMDPNGSPQEPTHRRRYVMDQDQLRVAQINLVADAPDGQIYELRREVNYEPTFDRIVEGTAWMRVVEGQVVSPRRSTTFAYDGFGRLSARVLPGADSAQAPTMVYSYELGNPSSRVITRQRSQAGGALDLESVQCLDGKGRTYQTRQLVGPGQYQVSGFTEFNARGAARRVYQPYLSASGQCDQAPPEGTLFTAYTFDADYRPLSKIKPDASLFGEASVSRTTYLPLGTSLLDEEDSDPSSPHHQTPTTTREDGQGRTVAVERLLTAGGEPVITRAHYDGLGRMTGYTDAQGNRKVQSFDLLGRVLRVDDPNTKGSTLYRYDDAGNVVSITDPRGIETLLRYDSLNRNVERWDASDREGSAVRWVFDAAPGCPAEQCTNTEGFLAEVSYPGVGGERSRDRFGYDLRSRKTGVTRSVAGVDFAFGYGYDNTNNLVRSSYPNGEELVWTRDAASRTRSLEGILDAIDYDERGLLGSVTRSDGSTQVMGYDALQRVSQSATLDGQGEVLQGWAYQYDRDGNLLEVEDLSDSTQRLNTSMTVSYDAWYRPTTVHYAASGETRTTGFDSINNITTRGLTGEQEQAFRYDPEAPNALTQAGDRAFAYDAAGHVTERGPQRLSWDHLGRVTRVEDASGELLRLGYGPGPDRLSKVEGDSTTLYLGHDFEVRDGISVLYAKMGKKRIARLEDDSLATALLSDLAPAGAEPDGQINAADAWLAHSAQGGREVSGEPSAPGALLMSSLRRLHAEAAPRVTHLYHDHLGSLTLATAQGEVVGRRSFHDMGQERDRSGYVDQYGFTGQELDRSTGLLHFQWRLYDPEVGRWMSLDPLFSISKADNFATVGESTTGYAYVSNNFINWEDPTGLKGEHKTQASPDGAVAKGKAGVQAKANEHVFKETGVKVKGVKEMTGIDANKYMKENFGHNKPFTDTASTKVYQGKLSEKTRFLRVHEAGKAQGTYLAVTEAFFTKLTGKNKLSPAQLQQELAIPYEPTHYSIVSLAAGSEILVGEVGPQTFKKSGELPGGAIQVINLDNKKSASGHYPANNQAGAVEIIATFPLTTQPGTQVQGTTGQ